LIEEFIEGRDVAVAWIDGASPATGGILPPIEYVFKTDNGRYDPFQIYDYNLKNHESDKVDLRVPAALPEDVKEKLMSFSRWAYKEISVRDLGRMDFRVTPDDEIFFIEVNALPSLEAGAGIFLAAEAAGLKNADAVFDAVIESASRRYNIKARKQSRRLERKLRVGFTYNEKRIIPGPDTDTDQEVEFDSPKTLGSIRSALASYGHEVIDLEATPDLPHLLTISDVDVVFNVAEGIRGRNREAQVPAILELMDIPHTGSDAATMALTLDKALAKRVVREAGLLTPKFFLMTSGRERVPADMPFPLIVKPVAEGSSKGVIRKSVVHNEAELRELAAEIVKRYGQAALAEEFLPGREFTVALLGERRPRALPPMEIIFTDKGAEFPVYTYQHKLEACREIRYQAPAQIDEKLREELERVARKSFAALGCRDVARIDFRLDGEGRVHFMECNPLPGLTPGWSDLCLIADSVKMDYRNLIGEILTPAIRRFKEKKKLLLQAEHHDDRTEAGTALPHP
ncbi:MAG TPA: D-alanine--D-alanine ligase, partial [Elusimicrobia bacterium]|nr:D-alanine--D-alanine ligase [Elusimicrobiota bacterium]